MSENEEIKFIDDVEEDVPPVPPDFNHLTNKKNSKDSTETKTTTTTTTTNKRSLRASVKKNQSNQITVGYNKTDDLPSFGDDRNSESILPVLEILDQMKTYAKISQNKLEFQKAKNSRKQKIFGSKLTDDSSFCSPKKIKEYLVSIRSNLYYFLERPVGMIGLFYRLFTFTLIVGEYFSTIQLLGLSNTQVENKVISENKIVLKKFNQFDFSSLILRFFEDKYWNWQ